MNTEEMLIQILDGQKQINEHLDNIDQRLGGMEMRMDDMDKRMGNMEMRMDNMDKRMGGMEKRMNNIEVQLEEIRHDGKITRVATNRIGEMLEEHLMYENT